MQPAELFLDRIRQMPDADGPRLIYADWLAEQGDPRSLFIRVQCALARLPIEDPRRLELVQWEQELLESHFAAWTEPFRGRATGLEFRRGFVEVVNVEAPQFLHRASELFDLAPIRHVRLLDVGGMLKKIADSPFVSRLNGLTCYAQHLGDIVPRTLADSPNLSALTRLELGRNRITDQGAEILAHSPYLSKLTHLDLSENSISDMGAGILSVARGLDSLERLDLHRNDIGPHGLMALITSSRLEQLTSLDLRHNHIGGPRTLDHARATTPLRLRALDVASNGIHSASAFTRDILDGPTLTGVELLDIGHNELGNMGCGLLARSPGVTSLHSLFLNNNHIGDDGIRAIATSIMLGRLTTLDLEQNPMIHDTGIHVLLEPSHLTWLRRLGLPGMGVTQRTRRALQMRYGSPRR